ncbi:MAG: hypothetical protein ABIH35_01960 [Patescibacteria group bacterium]
MRKTTFFIALLGFLFVTSNALADGGMMDYGLGNGFSGFGGRGIFHGIWMLVF